MEHNYELNTLIKYLYKETDLFETLEIEDALENDYFLAEEFNYLRNSFSEMPKVRFNPAKETMTSIISFSRNQQFNTAC